jgi:hypothetical protein
MRSIRCFDGWLVQPATKASASPLLQLPAGIKQPVGDLLAGKWMQVLDETVVISTNVY